MKRRLDALMADPAFPVAGDLMRLAFHASRFHPDEAVRASIGEAIDGLLDAGRVQAMGMADIAAAFLALPASPLAPMVAGEEDTRLVARLWRLSRLAQPRQEALLVVGSADAVGHGHGAILDAMGKAKPCSRRERPGVRTPFVNLGIARRPTDLAARASGDRAVLSVDRKAGARILLDIDADGGPLGSPASRDCTICAPPGPLGVSAKSFDDAALRIDKLADRRLAISPARPEAAIRFASHCTAGSMLHVDLARPPDGGVSVFVQLATLDHATSAGGTHPLAIVRLSRRGMLAQWASLPALPVALPLAPGLRAAIATHYATT